MQQTDTGISLLGPHPARSQERIAVRPTVPASRPVVMRVARGALQIRAARVGGVDIPNNKLIEYSLQYIFGVGATTAKKILVDSGVENKRTYELSEEELQKLRDQVDKYTTEGDLVRARGAISPGLSCSRCS